MKMISNKKTTILWVVIGMLVLINLVTLTSLWFSQPLSTDDNKRPRQPGSGHFIEERLNFSEEQTTDYQKMRQDYFEKVKPYYDEIRDLKKNLFENLKENNTENVNELAEKIGEAQAQIEILTFDHFMEVRNIGTEEQKIQFDSLMNRVVDRSVRPFPRGEGRWRRSNGN